MTGPLPNGPFREEEEEEEEEDEGSLGARGGASFTVLFDVADDSAAMGRLELLKCSLKLSNDVFEVGDVSLEVADAML